VESARNKTSPDQNKQRRDEKKYAPVRRGSPQTQKRNKKQKGPKTKQKRKKKQKQKQNLLRAEIVQCLA
jgi:hypothetical protein